MEISEHLNYVQQMCVSTQIAAFRYAKLTQHLNKAFMKRIIRFMV